ncbi:MAG: hypothetical protein ACWGSD_01470, partial [Thermodesulfobacteriota bacterium]
MPFGLLFTFFPGFILATVYGASLTETGATLARMLGGEFLCFGVITWLARDRGLETQLLLALGCLIGFSVGAVALVWAQLAGIFNALGWLMVLTYVFFGLAYGVIYLKRPAP